MMKKLEHKGGFRIFAFMLCLVMGLCSLTGCQLAREEAGEENQGKDQLVGVFITTEHLNLFNEDQWLKDNLDSIVKGQDVVVDEVDNRYYGKLYAVQASKVLYDESGEPAGETVEYRIEGVEGILYLCASMSDGENDYIGTQSDDGISDGKVAIHSSDSGDTVTMSGTVYMTPSAAGKGVYINPVFQEPGGGIYVVAGQGMVSGTACEGEMFSQKLEDSVTETENGVQKSQGTSIEISIDVTYPPEWIAVVQMNEENQIVSREEYIPGQTPEEIEAEVETAYILVEIYKVGFDGERTVSRELYLPEDKGFNTLVSRDDGICVQKWTRIGWEGNFE